MENSTDYWKNMGFLWSKSGSNNHLASMPYNWPNLNYFQDPNLPIANSYQVAKMPEKAILTDLDEKKLVVVEDTDPNSNSEQNTSTNSGSTSPMIKEEVKKGDYIEKMVKIEVGFVIFCGSLLASFSRLQYNFSAYHVYLSENSFPKTQKTSTRNTPRDFSSCHLNFYPVGSFC